MVELLRPVTGWDMDWAEGLTRGQAYPDRRHAFNQREGVDHDTFRLPKRFEEPLVAGPAAGGTPPPFDMLREGYYEAMGWDRKTGGPPGDHGGAGDRAAGVQESCGLVGPAGAHRGSAPRPPRVP